MTDIVERLRDRSMNDDWQVVVSEAHEAAAEIEKLRAQVRKVTLDHLAADGQAADLIEENTKLRAALRKIASNNQQRSACFCGACIQARAARAALEERT